MLKASALLVLGAVLASGCSGGRATATDVDSFIAQLQATPPERVESFVAAHQKEVQTAMADPSLKKRYLQVVLAKMPRKAP